MKLTKDLGILLLSVWLILHGVVSLVTLNITGMRPFMSVLALVAGILILGFPWATPKSPA